MNHRRLNLSTNSGTSVYSVTCLDLRNLEKVGAPLVIIKPKARIRQDKPMNKLEQEAFEVLGRYTYSCLRAQSITFKLANGVRFTPDITGIDNYDRNKSPRAICWEVKGKRFEDDAVVKIKVAASEYPEIRWILMWKDQGQWQFQEVLP